MQSASLDIGAPLARLRERGWGRGLAKNAVQQHSAAHQPDK